MPTQPPRPAAEASAHPRSTASRVPRCWPAGRGAALSLHPPLRPRSPRYQPRCRLIRVPRQCEAMSPARQSSALTSRIDVIPGASGSDDTRRSPPEALRAERLRKAASQRVTLAIQVAPGGKGCPQKLPRALRHARRISVDGPFLAAPLAHCHSCSARPRSRSSRFSRSTFLPVTDTPRRTRSVLPRGT